MAISNYLENKILEATLNGVDFTAPTEVCIALYTTDPTDDDIGQEVAGNGYARQPITFSTPSNGSISNSATIRFPVATDSWGTITHIGIRDSLSQGNLLYHGILAISQTISTNNQLVINEGQLVITLD